MIVFIPFVENLNDAEGMLAVILFAFAAQRDEEIFLDSCRHITIGEGFFFQDNVVGIVM